MRVYATDRFHQAGLSFSAPNPGDAGYDLRALESLSIPPGERALIPTGLHFEIPTGYVGLVKDRSSMALAGIHSLAGVIDSAYRGELKILLLNTTPEPYEITIGQKIAQMVVVPCLTQPVEFVATLDDLTTTERGAGGFGSTGKA